MEKRPLRKNFKKTIKGFIKDENGFVNKDKILKIGLGTVASMGVLSVLSDAYAGDVSLSACSLLVHTNAYAHNNGLACTTATAACKSCVPVDYPATDHLANHAKHFDHHSKQVSGNGTGCLSGKGCAGFSYPGCGAANAETHANSM